MWPLARRFILALALFALFGAAQALTPSHTLAQFHHTRWTAENGAPLGIRKMVQTTDGWLWLGSTSGLYRFDGVTFERFVPAGDPPFVNDRVGTLLATPRGDLWVTWLSGGVSRIDPSGRVVTFDQRNGLSSNRFISLEVDAEGAVWAATLSDVYRYEGDRWTHVDAGWNLPIRQFGGFYADRWGRFWVTDGQALHVLERGARRFSPVPFDMKGIVSFQSIDDGTWAFGRTTARKLPDLAHDAGDVAQGTRSSSTLIDRDRNLWSVYCDDGVCRRRLPAAMPAGDYALQAAPETLTARDGLSGDIGMTVLEDREGNVWVATQTGLDRFRNNRLVRLDLPTNLTNFQVASVVDGSVVVLGFGSRGFRLWRAAPALTEIALPEKLYSGLFDAGDMGVLLSGAQALWKIHGSSFERIAWPTSMAGLGGRGIAGHGGTLWALSEHGALQTYSAGQWQAYEDESLPTYAPTSIAADAGDDLWLGYRDNLVVVRGRHPASYGAQEGVDVGTITTIAAGRRVLIAGDQGVEFLQDGRFVRLGAPSDDAFRNVNGIVETADGDLWLNGLRGAVHITAAAFEEAARGLHPVADYTVLDTLDGYPNSTSPAPTRASAARDASGVLWFAGIGGVAWLDPHAPAPRLATPVVLIRHLRGDGRAAGSDGPVTFPAGTSSIDFSYTALSLSMPERTRFQVRLDGVDRDWRDTGSLREARYTNLAPGDYTLEVQATSPNQDWAGARAQVHFTLTPTFTQTWLFKALCALGLAAMLWWVYQRRIDWIASRMGERHRERLKERERIARVLHDTLLQAVQGLVLSFHAVAQDLSKESSEYQRLEASLERADALIEEGRDSVKDLRAPNRAEAPLAERLRIPADASRGSSTASIRIRTIGKPRLLSAPVDEEVFNIAREALTNAFSHANASRIELSLRFGRLYFRLRISDDGVGFEPSIAARGKAGHWGLAGMRERARRIRGHLGIHARPGHGTVVALRLLCHRAVASREVLDSAAP